MLFGALANVKAALAAGGAIAEFEVTQARRREIVESVGLTLREGACRATEWVMMSWLVKNGAAQYSQLRAGAVSTHEL